VLLVLVLAASIFGAGFPVVAKKVKWVKVPAKTFFICKHFGTGVLIATAFVHVREKHSNIVREQGADYLDSSSRRHSAT
jgi:hypothetical protein